MHAARVARTASTDDVKAAASVLEAIAATGPVDAAVCQPEILAPALPLCFDISTANDRAHRNIRRIEARLSPVNPKGVEDGCFYRAKNMRHKTLERLWAKLERLGSP